MVGVISYGRRVLETHLSVSWQAYGGKGRTDETIACRDESTPNHGGTSQGDQMQPFKISDTTGASLEDYTQLLADLLSFGRALDNHTHRVGKRLCQEVLRATHGKAWLVLPNQDSSTGRPTPFPVSVSFPVRFRKRDIPLAAYRAHLFSILE